MMHSSCPALQQQTVSTKYNFFDGHVDKNLYCTQSTVTQKSITNTNTTTTIITTKTTTTSTPNTPFLCV
jgi:hypothetical protein